VEAGWPLVGKALDLVRHDFEFEEMFEKHNADQLLVNCGPIGGWSLMLRTADDIDDVLVQKGDIGDIILKWPGALREPLRLFPHILAGVV
jgi:hypothetical protein